MEIKQPKTLKEFHDLCLLREKTHLSGNWTKKNNEAFLKILDKNKIYSNYFQEQMIDGTFISIEHDNL